MLHPDIMKHIFCGAYKILVMKNFIKKKNKKNEKRVSFYTDPINRFAAAVSNANPHKTTSNSFSKKRHVTPSLQLVPGQPNSIQLIW